MSCDLCDGKGEILYRVRYELVYPEADNDYRVAYVLANSFGEAASKLLQSEEDGYQKAYVKQIELLEAKVIV